SWPRRQPARRTRRRGAQRERPSLIDAALGSQPKNDALLPFGRCGRPRVPIGVFASHLDRAEGKMRFKSEKTGGYQRVAVSGTNTVSFAIDAADADTRGLLGFAVERHDPAENERYFMFGFKVFRSVIPMPDKRTVVTTFEHPIQSLVWDDFTGKPDREYEYVFHPLKGQPRNLDRTAAPISIRV